MICSSFWIDALSSVLPVRLTERTRVRAGSCQAAYSISDSIWSARMCSMPCATPTLR